MPKKKKKKKKKDLLLEDEEDIPLFTELYPIIPFLAWFIKEKRKERMKKKKLEEMD